MPIQIMKRCAYCHRLLPSTAFMWAAKIYTPLTSNGRTRSPFCRDCYAEHSIDLDAWLEHDDTPTERDQGDQP